MSTLSFSLKDFDPNLRVASRHLIMATITCKQRLICLEVHIHCQNHSNPGKSVQGSHRYCYMFRKVNVCVKGCPHAQGLYLPFIKKLLFSTLDW